jgi:excisionase family DNA binding protein
MNFRNHRQSQVAYYSVAEASALLRVSPCTIRRGVKSGRLVGLWIGPRTLRIELPFVAVAESTAHP